MMIYQWLPDFIDSVRQDGWPDAGRVMDVWFQAFMAIEPKPRKDETEAAAKRLRGRGLSGPGDYLAGLIPEILTARERTPEPATSSVPPIPAWKTQTAPAEDFAPWPKGSSWRELAERLAEESRPPAVPMPDPADDPVVRGSAR